MEDDLQILFSRSGTNVASVGSAFKGTQKVYVLLLPGTIY